MRDDGKRRGKGNTQRDVSRLLKVLVAGGVALAGVAGARAAETSPPSTDQGASPAGKSDAAGAKDKDKKKDEKKSGSEKKAPEEKKADEGGGVKGW